MDELWDGTVAQFASQSNNGRKAFCPVSFSAEHQDKFTFFFLIKEGQIQG